MGKTCKQTHSEQTTVVNKPLTNGHNKKTKQQRRTSVSLLVQKKQNNQIRLTHGETCNKPIANGQQ